MQWSQDSNVRQRNTGYNYNVLPTSYDSSFTMPSAYDGSIGEKSRRRSHGGWLSGKSLCIMCALGWLVVIPLLWFLWICLFVTAPIDPIPFTIPKPFPFLGMLKPNIDLAHAQRILEGQIIGPESLAIEDDAIFATTYDGRIVKIVNDMIVDEMRLVSEGCGRNCNYDTEKQYGRPLGLRRIRDGRFLVADSYKGIFTVDFNTRQVVNLVPEGTVVDGKPIRFFNDIEWLPDGRIAFTDSSSKWERKDFMYIFMEGRSNGRILAFDQNTRQVSLLLSNLNFPNGLQMSRDWRSLLICETSLARILRYHITGDHAGSVEIFAENLPGLPDNIRSSPMGGYWVGFAKARSANAPSSHDKYQSSTWLKKFLTKVFSSKTILWLNKYMDPKYGLIALLDDHGQLVRLLHDPTGSRIAGVSQVEQDGNVLYLGSYDAPYLGKLVLGNIAGKPVRDGSHDSAHLNNHRQEQTGFHPESQNNMGDQNPVESPDPQQQPGYVDPAFSAHQPQGVVPDGVVIDQHQAEQVPPEAQSTGNLDPQNVVQSQNLHTQNTVPDQNLSPSHNAPNDGSAAQPIDTAEQKGQGQAIPHEAPQVAVEGIPTGTGQEAANAEHHQLPNEATGVEMPQQQAPPHQMPQQQAPPHQQSPGGISQGASSDTGLTRQDAAAQGQPDPARVVPNTADQRLPEASGQTGGQGHGAVGGLSSDPTGSATAHNGGAQGQAPPQAESLEKHPGNLPPAQVNIQTDIPAQGPAVAHNGGDAPVVGGVPSGVPAGGHPADAGVPHQAAPDAASLGSTGGAPGVPQDGINPNPHI